VLSLDLLFLSLDVIVYGVALFHMWCSFVLFPFFFSPFWIKETWSLYFDTPKVVFFSCVNAFLELGWKRLQAVEEGCNILRS